jgi:microcystin-dependent protein
MASPLVGEIRLFAGNFAPAGWQQCDGSLLDISENETLFELIGTTYGGDGQSTFAVPDLRGRVPVHQGQGPGLGQSYTIGGQGGVETVALTTAQIPTHAHQLVASTAPGTTPSPQGNLAAANSAVRIYTQDAASVAMAGNALAGAGGSQPHENRMPVVAIIYIMSLWGVFPQPSPA